MRDLLGGPIWRGRGVLNDRCAASVAEAVPSAPVLALVSKTADSLTVSWPAPADGGSPITGYRLYVDGALAINPAISPQALVGLELETEYSIIVAALNVVGEGPQSAPLLVTTDAAEVEIPTVITAPSIAAGPHALDGEIAAAAGDYDGETNIDRRWMIRHGATLAWTEVAGETGLSIVITEIMEGFDRVKVQERAANATGDTGWIDSNVETLDVQISEPAADLAPYIGTGTGQIRVLHDARVAGSVTTDAGGILQIDNVGGDGALYDYKKAAALNRPAYVDGTVEWTNDVGRTLTADALALADNQHLVLRFWPNSADNANVLGLSGGNRVLLSSKNKTVWFFAITVTGNTGLSGSTSVPYSKAATTLEIRRQDGKVWSWINGSLIHNGIDWLAQTDLRLDNLGYHAPPQPLAFQSLAIVNCDAVNNSYDDPEPAVVAARANFITDTPSISGWVGSNPSAPPPTPGIPETSGPLADGGYFYTEADKDALRYTGTQYLPARAGYSYDAGADEWVGLIIGWPWDDAADPVLTGPYEGHTFPEHGGGTVHSVASPAELKAALAIADGGDVFELAGGTYDASDMSAHYPVNRYGPLGSLYFETPIVIRSAAPENPAVIRIGANGFAWTRQRGAVFDNIVFKYEFSAADTKGRQLVKLTRCTDLLFKNCRFEGDYADFPAGHADEDLNGMGWGHGLVLAGCSGVVFRDCVITKFVIGVVPTTLTLNYPEGSIVYPNRHLDFIGCYFTDIQQDGFSGGNINGWLVQDCTIHSLSGSVRKSHPDAAQVFSKFDMFALRNVTIDGCCIDVGDGGPMQSIFLNNENISRYQDGGQAGDYARHKNLVVTDNFIVNGHAHGISITGADGVKITNNTLVMSSLLGAAAYDTAAEIRLTMDVGCEDVTIRENIVSRIWTGECVTSYCMGDNKASWDVGDNVFAHLGPGDTAQPTYLPKLFTPASWAAADGAAWHRLIIDPASPAGIVGAGASMNYTGAFPALPVVPSVP